MTNKTYEKFKTFIKENYKFFLLLVFLFLVFNFRLPYYITTSGGLINVEDRIEMTDKKDIEGSFNLAYVNELHATLPTLLIAKLNDNWEILKEEDITADEEDIKDVQIRDSLLLEEANNIAVSLAFSKANKEIKVIENNIFVVYLDPLSDTDLKIGDEIVKVDNLTVTSKEQLYQYIKGKNENDKITFEVIRNNETITCTAITFKEAEQIFVGMMIANVSELETDPKVEFNFRSTESGSSGGLMMTLAIYNHLIDEDITKGRKIVGTGTIDEAGNVGSIGGVKYKLLGAIKEEADIFFVPRDKNYEELMNLEDIKDDIKIVPISTLDEAIEYLTEK